MNYYNAADTSMQSLVRFNEVAGQIQWIWSFAFGIFGNGF